MYITLLSPWHPEVAMNRILILGLLLLLKSAVGCTVPPNDREKAESSEDAVVAVIPEVRPRLEPPDPQRIRFDESSRTLELYDLPQSQAVWMVSLPGEKTAFPVTRQHTFGKSVPLDHVTVFYAHVGAVSPRVPLGKVSRVPKSPIH